MELAGSFGGNSKTAKLKLHFLSTWPVRLPSLFPTLTNHPRMLALSVAARLRRGIPMVAVAALVSSIPLAVAQQYPPPAFPSPGYSAPGGPSSPAYPYPGYGAPGAPPPPQQEVIPAPPGATMVWQPGYWSWRRHGWVWVSGLYVSRPYPHAIGFPVIGANDTAAGSGCRGIGDEIVTREIAPSASTNDKLAAGRWASQKIDISDNRFFEVSLASRAPEKFT